MVHFASVERKKETSFYLTKFNFTIERMKNETKKMIYCDVEVDGFISFSKLAEILSKYDTERIFLLIDLEVIRQLSKVQEKNEVWSSFLSFLVPVPVLILHHLFLIVQTITFFRQFLKCCRAKSKCKNVLISFSLFSFSFHFFFLFFFFETNLCFKMNKYQIIKIRLSNS